VDERDARGDPVARGVSAGQLDRRGLAVHGHDLAAGRLDRQAHRDAAAAGADVAEERHRRLPDAGLAEHPLHELLGLWPGNQRAAVHLQR